MTVQFEEAMLQRTLANVDRFTVKQLEIVIWAMAKRLASQFGTPLTDETADLR